MNPASLQRELVIGTHNRKKGAELAEMLSPWGIAVVTLADVPAAIEVVEEGDSFAANARLKAMRQARHLGRWVLADDSGLEVDALGGAPGVYSARFAERHPLPVPGEGPGEGGEASPSPGPSPRPGESGEARPSPGPSPRPGESGEASPSPGPSPGPGEGLPRRTRGKPLLDPEFRDFARKLRQQQSDAEKLMWGLLRNRRLCGLKFRRQHPVGRYVLDFYCHEARLAVEVDGGQHNTKEGRRHDQQRSDFLAMQGIRVLRYWNHEVLGDMENVLESIIQVVARPPSVEAATGMAGRACPSPGPSPGPGEGSDDAANNRYLLELLADTPLEKRMARYVCHVALADPTGAIRAESHDLCRGRIRFEPAGTHGFGYDPLFEVVEYHRTFGELGPSVKRAISHRSRAMRAILPELLRAWSSEQRAKSKEPGARS